MDTNPCTISATVSSEKLLGQPYPRLQEEKATAATKIKRRVRNLLSLLEFITVENFGYVME